MPWGWCVYVEWDAAITPSGYSTMHATPPYHISACHFGYFTFTSYYAPIAILFFVEIIRYWIGTAAYRCYDAADINRLMSRYRLLLFGWCYDLPLLPMIRIVGRHYWALAITPDICLRWIRVVWMVVIIIGVGLLLLVYATLLLLLMFYHDVWRHAIMLAVMIVCLVLLAVVLMLFWLQYQYLHY